MSNLEVNVPLVGDSANSAPGHVEVSTADSRVYLKLNGPERTIVMDIRRLKIAITALEADDDGMKVAR